MNRIASICAALLLFAALLAGAAGCQKDPANSDLPNEADASRQVSQAEQDALEFQRQIMEAYYSQHPEEREDASNPNRTAAQKATPEAVLQQLKPFLPAAAWGKMPEFEESALDDGNTLYYWHKTAEGSANNETEQQIEYVLNPSGKLEHYDYRSYSFELPQAPLTMPQAAAMAKAFANAFIGKGLQLQNVPEASPHIYNPGVMEGWVGTLNGIKYVISVDLQYGYVREVVTEAQPE